MPTTKPERFGLKRRLAAFKADEKGASLVEFSIVVGLFLTLLFTLIQYGLLFFVWTNMYDVAREAARRMAVGAWSEAAARTNATALLVDWPSGYTVTAQDVATTGTDRVRVVITLPGAEAGVVGVLPGPALLTAEVVMRKE